MAKLEFKPGTMLNPVPAVMVSCGEGNEKNIITIAWTGIINSDPPMTYISVRKERYSYDIIRKTGEFVINLTTRKLAYATDYCGVRSGRDVDKFREQNLTPDSSRVVKCPSIQESPVSIECRVKEIKELGSHHMFLADVLAVHAEEGFMDKNKKFRLNDARLLVYSHGEYMATGKTIGTFGYSVKKQKKNKKKV